MFTGPRRRFRSTDSAPAVGVSAAHLSALISADKPADVITVYEYLQNLGKAEECGRLAYPNSLAQYVPSASNIRRYAEITSLALTSLRSSERFLAPGGEAIRLLFVRPVLCHPASFRFAVAREAFAFG